jgi:uncharacterized damage-inducible protein DinB
METRPHPVDKRGRSVREHMVHQCVSEDTWFRNMFGIEVGAPPLPPVEARSEFIRRYAEDAKKRLAHLQSCLDAWWEEEVKFFNVSRPRTWIMVRRIAHTAHHRGQQMALLRMLNRDVYSTYGPTGDTGGLTANGATVSTRMPTSSPSLLEVRGHHCLPRHRNRRASDPTELYSSAYFSASGVV